MPGSPRRDGSRGPRAADQARCTLAYMHHPRFSSGETGSTGGGVEVLWEVLYEANTDVVPPATSTTTSGSRRRTAGRADPSGHPPVVVGTAAAERAPISSDPTQQRGAHDGIDGVLELTLRPKGYEWEFIPVGDESFTDSGDGQCH